MTGIGRKVQVYNDISKGLQQRNVTESQFQGDLFGKWGLQPDLTRKGRGREFCTAAPGLGDKLFVLPSLYKEWPDNPCLRHQFKTNELCLCGQTQPSLTRVWVPRLK